MSHKVGFVYVVQMEDEPVFKIGKAKDVPRRMSDFGLQLPFRFNLRFAHKVLGYDLVELALHKELASQRVNGEWFRLTEIDVLTIQGKLLVWQAWLIASRLHEKVSHSEFDPNRTFREARALAGATHRLHRRQARYFQHDIISVAGLN